MAAKKTEKLYSTPKDVPTDWATRKILLGVPEVMSIANVGYTKILNLIADGTLKPVGGMSKPFRFAPGEIEKAFFNDPKEVPKRKTSNEPRKKKDLWR